VKPLFIHIPRTGGNTIRQVLGSAIQSYHHDNVMSLKERLGFRWDDTFKFSVVRNPWDRAYSAYLLHSFDRQDRKAKFKPDSLHWQREDFHEWLHLPWKDGGWYFQYSTSNMLVGESGTIEVDSVWQFECGVPGIIRDLCERMGIEQRVVTTHAKKAHFRRKFTYRDVIVDDDDIELIADAGWVETDIFGYEY